MNRLFPDSVQTSCGENLNCQVALDSLNRFDVMNPNSKISASNFLNIILFVFICSRYIDESPDYPFLDKKNCQAI